MFGFAIKRWRRQVRGTLLVIPSSPCPLNYYRFRKSPEWSEWLTNVEIMFRSSDKPRNLNIMLGSSNNLRPIFPIQLGHLEFPALVDTGANKSILGAAAWNRLAENFFALLTP